MLTFQIIMSNAPYTLSPERQIAAINSARQLGRIGSEDIEICIDHKKMRASRMRASNITRV
jgi:hypothetical protein